jgi:transcriptional regulator with XRE-family HTH domain
MTNNDTELSTYAELADVLANLGTLLRMVRKQRDMSFREIGDIIGVHHATLSRLERHVGSASNDTAIRLLRWLHSLET